MVLKISREKIEATCYCVALSLAYTSIKEEQREIITSFIAGPMQYDTILNFL